MYIRLLLFPPLYNFFECWQNWYAKGQTFSQFVDSQMSPYFCTAKNVTVIYGNLVYLKATGANEWSKKRKWAKDVWGQSTPAGVSKQESAVGAFIARSQYKLGHC